MDNTIDPDALKTSLLNRLEHDLLSELQRCLDKKSFDVEAFEAATKLLDVILRHKDRRNNICGTDLSELLDEFL